MVYPNGRCFLGNNCKAPTHDLAPRYKCHHCGVQLHPPPCGCSVFFGEDEDGIITCLPDMAGTNCAARRCTQPTSQQGKKKKPKLLSQTHIALGSRSTKPPQDPPLAKKLNKSGRKKGTVTESKITRGQWYHACKTYRELKGTKMAQAEFLRSSRSDAIFTGARSQKSSFSRWLKHYDEGKLQDSDMMREKKREFIDVELKLCAYLRARAEQYQTDKCGVSWLLLQEKCKIWGDELGHAGKFSVSNGWLNDTMKRYGFTQVNLHGEANDMTDDERETVMVPFRKKLQDLCEELGVGPECLYNADQSGILYQKLPNSLYVDKDRKKQYAGTKLMKDKTRITIMVCTAANGVKFPLAIIGKPKKPACFRLLPDQQNTPIPYTNQSNAWFDKFTTVWWIKHVFWPEHLKRHGDVHAILLLDNCSAHKIDEKYVPKNLHILFLPPNVTNRHQPADMGMIAGTKVGYKALYLRALLEIFDAPGGCEHAAEERKKQKRGCRGVKYGGKPHILDCMEMLKTVWDGEKYVSTESISRCWRKADILPVTWNADINNEVGSASMPERDKVVSDEILNEMCNLMTSVQLKAEDSAVDTETVASVLKNTFVTEKEISKEDLFDMIENWIDEEDEEEIADGIIHTNMQDSAEYDDSEEDDDDIQVISAGKENRKKLTHVDATAAIDVLREYISSLDLSGDCAMSLARLQRQIISERTKAVTQQPSINSMFPSKAKK